MHKDTLDVYRRVLPFSGLRIINSLYVPMFITTRSRIVSILAGAATVASFVSLTPIAQAASLTTAQIDAITGLLQSFNADPVAIANVKAVLNGTTPTIRPHKDDENYGTTTPKMTPPRACPAIHRGLKKGSSGDDVSGLQEFLKGEITGYFGPKTAEKVKNWQIEHGIIATSTSAANGAGIVGPKTRMVLEREIQKKCGIGQFKNDSSTATSTTVTSTQGQN